MRSRPLLYSAGLFLLGLAYRATFLSQGFNATDEGWLQSLGRRVAEGQVPYRDFYFVLPPVSLYREAALIRVFGDAYGILASRWVFATEATLASVLAYIILRRVAGDRLALLSSIPTVFFSVIFYYFSNYTYDAVLLTLAAFTAITYADRAPRTMSAVAGAAAALAFLAKPTFLAFAVLIPLAGIASARLVPRRPSPPDGDQPTAADWRFFGLGFALAVLIVAGALALLQALGPFLYQAFALTRQAFPTSASFLLWQDLPDRLLAWPVFPALVGLLVLILLPGRRAISLLRLPLIALVLAYFLFRVIQAPGNGPPTGRQEAIVVLGLGLLLILNGVALLLSVAAHGPWFKHGPLWEALRREIPAPLLVFFALSLEYVTQINYSGIRYSYMGTFLSLPMATLFIRGLARATGRGREGALAAGALGAIVATWYIAGATAVTRGTVYRDGDRAQLTASFRTPKLAGITSRPANVRRLDRLVAAIGQYSRPGDPILVFPDLPVMYFLTDRPNPTRIDWYDPSEIIPRMTLEAVADLERHPASVVIIQTYDEADVPRAGLPLHYASEPKWAPLFAYLTTHYTRVAQVDDFGVFQPLPQP